MIDAQTYLNEQSEKGYHYPYTVQLLLEKDVKLDHEKLPEKFVISDPESIENPLQIFSPAIIQTWDWPDAEQAVSNAKAVVEISDAEAADALARKDRLQIFHNAVQALLNIVQPVAIHWLSSQRIVSPQRYVEDLAEGGLLFSSAVNVRMFKIEQSDERIMDTMGLTGLGCWDLQSHFKNLDPAKMGLYLYHLAEYVFERGDVIRDGDSVEGIEPTERWRCRKEGSYVPPSRRVINVIPGEYAPPG